MTDRLGLSVAHGIEDFEQNYVVVGATADLSFGRLTLSGSLLAMYPLHEQ